MRNPSAGWLALGVLAAGLCVAGGARAAERVLFPEPFLVEHQVVQVDGDGSVFATEPVVDRYGGSWIVSERADGSRLVVDFARREIVEIRPERGAYTVLSFDRFAELSRRLRELEGAPREADAKADEPNDADLVRDGGEAVFRISELPAAKGLVRVAAEARRDGPTPAERDGVRHLRVALDSGEDVDSEPAVDVWLDPRVRLTPDAMDALDGLETEVLGAPDDADAPAFSRYVAAARRSSGGALPVRTERPAARDASRRSAGTVTDVALRVESLASFPRDLVRIPEGLERMVHPLEQMVAFAEDEAELRARTDAAMQQAR